ncbi:WhiB family transcriptional regulator [Kitasatospora sp. NPDC017646]|uniref:WhiB family transcriptional regulator n=1 Tax=Kitasatospora sp. NPDC017646 TaxID=3364024 RepID=UPI0037A1068F
MSYAHFVADHASELGELIHQPNHLDRQLRRAACRGMDPDAFHPEEGRPDDLVIARCTGCKVRLACLALALRTEDPDARSGWYGGFGPEDRSRVATVLGLETPDPPVPDRVAQAAHFRTAGWTVEDIATELGCSRRTVQRALRTATA